MRCLAAFLLICAAGVARADEVVLAAGGSLWGEVTESGDGYLLRMAHGEVRLGPADVARVVDGESPAAEYARRAGDLGCDEEAAGTGHGADAHLELARFCRSRGMGAEAGREYDRALLHDPGQPEALRAVADRAPREVATAEAEH
jgi:hypothetical protein